MGTNVDKDEEPRKFVNNTKARKHGTRKNQWIIGGTKSNVQRVEKRFKKKKKKKNART